ncbi:hypothetical protein P154DRAFT_576187 [Amniculicola lignicola CBS 123094]|uniref:Uncharacterized protein n=1 Tax=Amniculicola lignicola CBS 123094 TaxID=1392246 RepID=A0A6A5WE45_9PLEO|nr:hypothetical protein P154DRAFT_576187 [Amniculicola lignicola CBS 123094]
MAGYRLGLVSAAFLYGASTFALERDPSVVQEDDYHYDTYDPNTNTVVEARGLAEEVGGLTREELICSSPWGPSIPGCPSRPQRREESQSPLQQCLLVLASPEMVKDPGSGFQECYEKLIKPMLEVPTAPPPMLKIRTLPIIDPWHVRFRTPCINPETANSEACTGWEDGQPDGLNLIPTQAKRSPWFEEPPPEGSFDFLEEQHKEAMGPMPDWKLDDLLEAVKNGEVKIEGQTVTIARRSPWFETPPTEDNHIADMGIVPELPKEILLDAINQGKVGIATKRSENGDFPMLWTEPRLEIPPGDAVRSECKTGCKSCCARLVASRGAKRAIPAPDLMPLPLWGLGGGCQENGGTEEECKKWFDIMTTTCAGGPGVCDRHDVNDIVAEPIV